MSNLRAAPQEPAQKPSHSSSAPRILIDRALLEKALAALNAGLKLSPESEFHDRLRVALKQKHEPVQEWTGIPGTNVRVRVEKNHE